MRLILGSLIVLGWASFACAQDAEGFELAEPTAVALDADGIPMFRADRAFLLELVGTEGRIFAAKAARVRISPDGQSEVWLRCADLKPLKACDSSATPATRAREPDGVRGGGVPNCPGDPRCPRRRPA